MNRWLDRPGYVAMAAFVAGAAVAAIVLVFIFVGGGDDGGEQPLASATPGTPATATTPGTRTPAAVATATVGAFADPFDAVAAFVRDELQSVYNGPCPEELLPDETPPAGTCSSLLHFSEELITLNIGPFASEALGEAVLLPNADGTWSLTFLQAPSPEAQITVGADAMVFQAGDCLRFREEPTTSAETVSCQLDGTSATVVDGPVQADGHTWWQLEGYGWASDEYLAPAQ